MVRIAYNKKYDILQLKLQESSLTNSFFFMTTQEVKPNIYLIKDKRNDEIIKLTVMNYKKNKDVIEDVCKKFKINFSIKRLEDIL